LSIHTDASAGIAHGSTCWHSRWKRLARWLARVNWRMWLLFYLFWCHFNISRPVKWQ